MKLDLTKEKNLNDLLDKIVIEGNDFFSYYKKNTPKISDKEYLINLTSNFKEKGIITPITVRKADKGYEIVAGERRFRAAKNLKLHSKSILNR